MMASVVAAIGQTMSKEEMTRRIDEVFGAVYNNPDEPGAAVLIMQAGDTLYSRCLGVADMETKAPVTFATNFCIASVSKQFSAVALLQLAEQGILSLDDPLSKFFPEFQAPFFNDITLHNIMSHTSGIPDARSRGDRNFVLYSTDVESVGYMKTLDHLNFQPGTQYEYINPTFQLIYQIVERATGIPFETYMHENVFGKAGMQTCRYYEPDRNIACMAHGYERDDKGVWQEYDYGEESFFATMFAQMQTVTLYENRVSNQVFALCIDLIYGINDFRLSLLFVAGSKRHQRCCQDKKNLFHCDKYLKC